MLHSIDSRYLGGNCLTAVDDNVEENIPGVSADIMSYGSVAAPRGGNNFQYRPELVTSSELLMLLQRMEIYCHFAAGSQSVNTLVNTRHAITASWGGDTILGTTEHSLHTVQL